MQAVRVLAVLLAAALFAPLQEPVSDTPPPFDDWLQALIAEARERGYSPNLVDETLVGLQPVPRVIKEDRSQA
jgi:membrane-bound lytic murein transglycosylase B